MRGLHAMALHKADDATRDEVCEAITTLEELVRIGRRVFGTSHPNTYLFQKHLVEAKATLARLHAGA